MDSRYEKTIENIINEGKFKITGGNSRLLVSGMKAGFLQDFMYI